MKTIKTLKIVHKDKPFIIKVYKTSSPSNYNLFASVFKIGKDIPLVGTTFRSDTTNDKIKVRAERCLNWPEMQCFIID